MNVLTDITKTVDRWLDGRLMLKLEMSVSSGSKEGRRMPSPKQLKKTPNPKHRLLYWGCCKLIIAVKACNSP